MPIEKSLDPGKCCHKALRECRIRRLSDNDQECNRVALNRGQLVRCVSDALVVRDGNAPVSAAILEPLLVRTIVREEITVSFDDQSRVTQPFREPLPQIAIGEIDAAQAARS